MHVTQRTARFFHRCCATTTAVGVLRLTGLGVCAPEGEGGQVGGGGAHCVRWAHLCTPLPYPPLGVARKVTVPEKHARSIYVYCVVASRANVLCACTLSTADEGITLITVLYSMCCVQHTKELQYRMCK